MKRILFLIIVSLSTTSGFSQGSVSFQDKEFIHSAERDRALDSLLSDPSSAAESLSTEEREAIYWINYVRKQPGKFYQEILAPFLKQFPEVKSSYSKSLATDLLNAPSLPVLLPSDKLNIVASSHARDLGSTGSRISHSSSKGASFQERMNKAGLTNCVAENIYEGRREALESVIFLLIDQGVNNLGHRKNILSKTNKFIGVSFYPIKNRTPFYFLVQDFSCD